MNQGKLHHWKEECLKKLYSETNICQSYANYAHEY